MAKSRSKVWRRIRGMDKREVIQGQRRPAPVRPQRDPEVQEMLDAVLKHGEWRAK